MMGQAYFPDNRNRSATAIAGQSDLRDENLFSAVALCHGGAGQTKVFTIPQGQTLPALKGSSITVAQAHQTAYTEVTTNLTKAGELGSAIGDASIRSVGLTLETASYLDTAATVSLYGATQNEVADVASKVFFQLKIAGKIQIQGPVWAFPPQGGVDGNISTTGNNVTQAIANLGVKGQQRRLKLPILVARTDTIEGVVGVAGSASLAFRTTSAAGQASLLTIMLSALVKGDVR